MVDERWCKATGMVVLTSTETNTILGLHWHKDQEWLAGPEMDYLSGW
jgi:hypothetical protein